ncbi:undecaprenyl/decaprenyl-phosphate alpha-N-acetylglucosaminyl 1-phosphate transferase [Patescibacteria group bacterium]|nr:undecaprenyl/decaprenyl-phosphate alpha-N-acetylglucosaminyl 1-phosphate transferase [Patescibacteria group bacterium]
MENLSKLVFLPGVISIAIAFFTTPFVIKLAKKFGLIDDPRSRKHPKIIHTYPVPRAGGFAIFLAVSASALLFLPLDKHLKGILAGALILTILGLLDDKFDLNPYLRLVIQFVAASAPIIAGIGIAFISSPIGGIIDLSHPQINFYLFGEPRSIWILSDLFALFWIVMLMNFINMGAKGVDGQLPGVTAIAALTIALLSLSFSADITQWPIIILAVITAGAYLGFLPWNFYPQKIMPGFSGSNLAGYLLGVLSILSTAKVGTLFVVLGVPLIDSGYTVMRRILTKKSPFWGDAGHLHHKLLRAGLSKRQVAYFYWLVTAILGALALNLNTSTKLYTIVGLAALIGGLILWLTYRPKSLK